MQGAKVKGIELEDFFYRPELILAVAGLLMIIGSFGAWGSWGFGIGGVSGWDFGSGKATFFMGLIMLYSSAVEMGYIKIIERVVPILSTSAICGSVSFILSVSFLDAYPNNGWGLYLVIIASLIALFAAFQAYMRRSSRRR